MRLELLGVGAMRSPRFAPAGLLVSAEGLRVAIDGGAEGPSFGEFGGDGSRYVVRARRRNVG